jgi:uncharacterized protein (TIGR01777 family)
MRTIITGGTGLIGRALATDLAANGHQVVLLSRDPGRATDLPAGVTTERWDARTSAGWGHLADGAHAIVNLAGENIGAGRWTAERKRRIRASRVDAGQAVVQAVRAAENKPDVVIQSSAVGIYGPRGDEEITESASAGSDFLSQIAVQWEASTAPVDEMGVRRPIIRTGVVFSKQAMAFQRMVLPFKLFVGGPIGGGRQWLPWVHIADEVGAIRFLMSHPKAAGPFNLTAPETVTNAGFGRTLGQVLGRPSFMPVPGFAMRLAFGEMSTVLLDGQRAVPQRLVDLGFTFRYPKLETALRDLLR